MMGSKFLSHYLPNALVSQWLARDRQMTFQRFVDQGLIALSRLFRFGLECTHNLIIQT